MQLLVEEGDAGCSAEMDKKRERIGWEETGFDR